MAEKPAADDVNYPRKYWWLVLIVVPLALALIQAAPWRGAGATGSSSSFTARDITMIVNQAPQSGGTLSEDLVAQLRLAVEHSESGQHAAAAAAMEKVRDAGSIGALPALQVALADEYRLAGREDEARRTYEAVLQKEGNSERALDGLGRLPAVPLEGLQLVNFSGERENIWGDARASNIVDGNPGSAWVARDGQFPQTFILALPRPAAISEVTLNNPAYGEPNRGAKDVEISVSASSAGSGFEVAATAALAPNDIGQGIPLKSAPIGRWIKIRVLSNHGNKEATTLGDVVVTGRPAPGGRAD